jgi:Anthranilate/para-aminobenzoate synthases component I
MVSEVEATLKEGVHPFDVLLSALPVDQLPVHQRFVPCKLLKS